MPAIETVDLVWYPREVPARCVLDHVTLRVSAGSVTALCGHNGSGKTTLLRMLAALLAPRSGRASVNGADVAQEPHRVRASIGWLPEETGLPDRATPLWHLRFHALLRGHSWASATRLAMVSLASLGVETLACEPMGTLSRGTRQRIGIARALLCDPAVLLLDEPDANLDEEIATVVGEIARCRAASGRTVLAATHDRSWAHRFCDEALDMSAGRISGGAAR